MTDEGYDGPSIVGDDFGEPIPIMESDDEPIDAALEEKIKLETQMIKQIQFQITKMIPKVDFPLTTYTFAYMLYFRNINGTQLSSYLWEDIIGFVSMAADNDEKFQQLWAEIIKVPEPTPQGIHPAARR